MVIIILIIIIISLESSLGCNKVKNLCLTFTLQFGPKQQKELQHNTTHCPCEGWGEISLNWVLHEVFKVDGIEMKVSSGKFSVKVRGVGGASEVAWVGGVMHLRSHYENIETENRI